jgi:hypothetical protein
MYPLIDIEKKIILLQILEKNADGRVDKEDKINLFLFVILAHNNHKNYVKEQCHGIFDFKFFHESSSFRAVKILTAAFQIFTKICEDICISRCTLGVNTVGRWENV